MEFDLRRLSRAQLLEMLLAQSKEVSRLQEELQQTRRQLEDRRIMLTEAGNIAEAALRLNGVFTAAQDAADEYLTNLSRSVQESQDNCRIMEEETKRKCEQMIQDAKLESARLRDNIKQEIYDSCSEKDLKDIIDYLNSKSCI